MYLNVTDTAKLIRRVLKEAFPKHRFSVRANRYSLGASIDVRWEDGPDTASVNSLIRVFESKRFDGRDDSTTYVRHIFEGEETSFGCDYVSATRSFSESLLNRAKREVEAITARGDATEIAQLRERLYCRAVTDHEYIYRRYAGQLSLLESRGSPTVTAILLANPWLVEERSS